MGVYQTTVRRTEESNRQRLTRNDVSQANHAINYATGQINLLYPILKAYKYTPVKSYSQLFKDYVCEYISKFLLNKLHISEYGICCSILK